MSADSPNEDKDTTESYQAITAGHGKTQPQLPSHFPLEQLDTNVFERNCIARTDSEYNIVPILAMRIPTHFRSSDSAVPSSPTHRDVHMFYNHHYLDISITTTIVSLVYYIDTCRTEGKSELITTTCRSHRLFSPLAFLLLILLPLFFSLFYLSFLSLFLPYSSCPSRPPLSLFST